MIGKKGASVLLLIFEILVVVAVLKIMLDFTYKSANSESNQRVVFARNFGLAAEAAFALDGNGWSMISVFPDLEKYSCDVKENMIIIRNKNFSWKKAEGIFHPVGKFNVLCPLESSKILKYDNKILLGLPEGEHFRREYQISTQDFSLLGFDVRSECDDEKADIGRDLVKILELKGLVDGEKQIALIVRCDSSDLRLYYSDGVELRDFARKIANAYKGTAYVFGLDRYKDTLVLRYPPEKAKDVLSAFGDV